MGSLYRAYSRGDIEMSISSTESGTLFYFALKRKGKRFIEAAESEMLGMDRPVVPELSDYLRHHYRRIISEVELAGSTYSTYVYIPVEGDDLSYVIADINGVPKDAPSSEPITLNLFEEYLSQLKEKLSYTEAISPEQASYLGSQFMTPTFSELDPEGKDPIIERSWEDVLHRNRTVIMGEPGAGKTTCLRKLAIEVAARRSEPSQNQVIPVYIQLREWDQTSEVIENARRQLLQQNAVWVASNVEKLCEAGRLLIILDGLDELPTNVRDQGVESILQVARLYPRLGLIVSTRNTGYDWRLPGFSYFEINPFSEAKIKEWTCQRLYDDKGKSWKLFFNRLHEQPDLLHLASNPLMLSIAVFLYRRSSLLPQNKATLIGQFVDALVDLWDVVRGVTRSAELWAAPSKKLSTLCRSAFFLRKCGKRTFSYEDFFEWEQGRTDQDVADQMLPILRMHTGLLRTDEHGRSDQWYFRHECITDYLAARHLVERTEDTSLFLRGRLSDEQWQEIWLLACGITQDATHLTSIVLTSEISDVSKAILLATAFAQNLSLDQGILEEGCSLILSAFEALMERLEVLDPLKNEEEKSVLWSLTLQRRIDEVEFDSHEDIDLRRLLKSLYKARSGIAQKLLGKMLKNSHIRAVSAFSHSLDFNGRYQDTVAVIENRNLLSISIYPESPNLEGV